MHGAACLELPKLYDDKDGWKIQPALHDVTGWMHASKTISHPLVLPWLDDFAPHVLLIFWTNHIFAATNRWEYISEATTNKYCTVCINNLSGWKIISPFPKASNILGTWELRPSLWLSSGGLDSTKFVLVGSRIVLKFKVGPDAMELAQRQIT